MPDAALPSIVLSDVTLAEGRSADIAIAGAAIATVGPPGTLSGRETIAGTGLLAMPSLVDGHIHLDKTLMGLPFIPHVPGEAVADRIAHERTLRKSLPLSVFERGGRLIEAIAALGTGFVRSHVDIDTQSRLDGLHEVLRLREAYADLLDIQIVAFPQSGILREPGAADLLDAALSEGADLVGGLDPAGIDGDVAGHLDMVFGLAQKHGRGIDIHLHDPGELGLFQLRDIAARTKAAGMSGKVAVSHAFALGEPLAIGRTVAALAEAGVAIVTNAPGPAPMPPVKALVEAGVSVFAGSDNIRDAWSPYGDGDMLARAALVGYRQRFNADPDIALALAMATSEAADNLGIARYGIAPGNRADLVLVRAACLAEAVVAHPPRALVLKAGRVVVRDGRLCPR